MQRSVKALGTVLVLATLAAGGCGMSAEAPDMVASDQDAAAADDGPPTVETYLERAGASARFYDYGKLKIGGARVYCGRRPTVFDPDLDSWGGSFPGFMILNPARLKGLAPVVQRYVYAHECGHQFQGEGESAADCFAVRRGVTHGWLDARGMERICTFISKLKAKGPHPPGPVRCTRMRACFKKATAELAQSGQH